MNTEEEIRQLNADLRAARKDITDLRIAIARNEGGHKVAALWAFGMAALVAAWFGATSAWHIPSLVRATAAGEAKQKAEDAAKQAQEYEVAAKEAAGRIRAIPEASLPAVEDRLNKAAKWVEFLFQKVHAHADYNGFREEMKNKHGDVSEQIVR